MTSHISRIGLMGLMALSTVSANAEVTLEQWDGLQTLSLTQSVANALNVGAMQIMPVHSGWWSSTVLTNGAQGSYSNVIVDAYSIDARFLDPETETALTLAGWKGHGGFQIEASPLAGISQGGLVTITNFDVSFATGQIFTDVQTSTDAPSQRELLWQFNPNLVQTHTLPDNDLEDDWDARGFVVTIPQLSLAPTGRNVLQSSLGLEGLGTTAWDATAQNFGNLTFRGYAPSNITITVVPEPGTWALMGLGLVGLAGLSRARSRQACAESA